MPELVKVTTEELTIYPGKEKEIKFEINSPSIEITAEVRILILRVSDKPGIEEVLVMRIDVGKWRY